MVAHFASLAMLVPMYGASQVNGSSQDLRPYVRPTAQAPSKSLPAAQAPAAAAPAETAPPPPPVNGGMEDLRPYRRTAPGAPRTQ
jgi:hypothetical protein